MVGVVKKVYQKPLLKLGVLISKIVHVASVLITTTKPVPDYMSNNKVIRKPQSTITQFQLKHFVKVGYLTIVRNVIKKSVLYAKENIHNVSTLVV